MFVFSICIGASDWANILVFAVSYALIACIGFGKYLQIIRFWLYLTNI